MNEKFLEHDIGFNEYITGNRFIDICQDTGATFCKTDYISSFTNTKTKVFVTHNSDYHICNNRYLAGPSCDFWFAQNKEANQNKICSIPIGLENMKLRTYAQAANGLFSSQVPGSLQKAMLIDKISSYRLQKKGMVYMNFNRKTHHSREYVWQLFESKNWVNNTSNLQLQKFYFDLAEHKFVISPRGNGVDCHRTWEALYLRTIPIVESSIHMNEFSDLPIFFVNSWDELCYNNLEKFYNKVQNELYNLDKLKISYWRKTIDEKLSR